MPTTLISPQSLTQTTAGAADDHIVRVKNGTVVTARQSFFGRILRFFPGGTRNANARRAETEAIRDVLLTDLKQRFEGGKTIGQGIAETALRMVGLDPAETPSNTPITVRQIREAHACAKVLSAQAIRSAAGLAALTYSPAAPGFAELARRLTGIDPESLTPAQQSHYEYMLQRHVALDPAKYQENGAALQKLAITAFKYVSRMSNADIDAAQSTMLTQRDRASAVLDDLASGDGMTSLVENLDQLHDACHQGAKDAMLGDVEYGAFMTIDTLALERAAMRLTPQQARAAYLDAMASDGAGRAMLAALDEQADKLSAQSRISGADDSNGEPQLGVGAKRARELHSTAHIVLKVLGERGGVEDVERQLLEVSRQGAERTKAASTARTAVTRQLHQAVSKETVELRARAELEKQPRVAGGDGVLIPMQNEQLGKTLETEDPRRAMIGDRPVRVVNGAADQATQFFGNGFYQDMNRMHVILESNGAQTRIGTTSTPNPTEDEKRAAKLEGIERLVEFVGDEVLAARVSRLINQKLFAPVAEGLEAAEGPIHLADGTRGQILPVPGTARRSFTLSRTGDGEISVRVEQDYAARAVTTPPHSIRELDGEQSYLRTSFEFSITRDAVRARSPVTYDFRLVEAG
jgi:hypothetical protein